MQKHRFLLAIKLILTGITIFSVMLVCAYFIYDEVAGFRHASAQIEKEYIDNQKTIVHSRVEQATVFVKSMREQGVHLFKQMIRDRTYEAYTVAMNLYEENQKTKTPEEIKKLIRDALRPVRFNRGSGFFYINDLNGIAQLSPTNPSEEGQPVINRKNLAGKYIIRDMIDIIKTKKEGFYEYEWTKPGKKEQEFEKIAYVKLFEPLNWYIGTSEYLDVVERTIKRDTIDKLSRLRLDGEEGFTFFVLNEKRINLCTKTQLGSADSPMKTLALASPKTAKLFDAAVEQSDAEFTIIDLPVSGMNEQATYMMFIKKDPAWNWLIGTGFNLDNLAAPMALQQAKLRETIITNVKVTALLLGILLVLLYGVLHLFSKKISSEFNAFSDFFSQASHENKKIPLDEIYYDEFNQLAQEANHMTDQRIHFESELSKFKNIAELANYAVLITDHSTGELLYANDYFAQTLGYTPEEIKGKNISMFFSKKQAEDLNNLTKSLQEGDCFNAEEVCHLHKNGSELPMLMNGMLIKDLEGGRPFVASTATDITRLKEAEQTILDAKNAAEYANVAKRNFLANVTHELRTPMNAVLGFSELLSATTLDPEQKTYLSTIYEGEKKLINLIDTILDYTSIEAGQFVSNESDFSLERLLVRTITHLKETNTQLENNEALTISYQIDADVPPKLKGDLKHIQSVLLSLLENAVKFTSKGSVVVSVSLMPNESAQSADPQLRSEMIRFHVQDTGNPAGRDKYEYILQPEKLIAFSDRIEYSENGLGLIISKMFVDAMGGNIWMDNMSEKGTAIAFTLPLTTAGWFVDPEDKVTSTAGKRTSCKGVRVLVVEDIALNRALIGTYLKRMGCIFDMADDGHVAVDYMREKEYDIVLMDLMMTHMNGMEATEIIRKEINQTVPIIALTVATEEENKIRAKQAGMSGFLAKPITQETLQQNILKWL